jgi:hypothetical protein
MLVLLLPLVTSPPLAAAQMDDDSLFVVPTQTGPSRSRGTTQGEAAEGFVCRTSQHDSGNVTCRCPPSWCSRSHPPYAASLPLLLLPGRHPRCCWHIPACIDTSLTLWMQNSTA